MKKWGTAVFLSVLLHVLVIHVLPDHQPLSLIPPKPQRINLVFSAPNKAETRITKKETDAKTKPSPQEPLRAPRPIRRQKEPPQEKKERPSKASTVKSATSTKETAARNPSNLSQTDLKDTDPEARVGGGNASMAEKGSPASSQNNTSTSGGSSQNVPVRELEQLHVTQRVTPVYPVMSRKREEKGTVYLLARIEGGRVVNVKVEKSSGYVRLDQSAENAVKKWRFSIEEGAVLARIPIIFKLKE